VSASVRTKRLGYRGPGSQDHGRTLQERQGSVLTNQCLGTWKGTNAERGAEENFLTDSDKFIVERHWGKTSEQRFSPTGIHIADKKYACPEALDA